MSIIYGAIAKEQTLLAEYCEKQHREVVETVVENFLLSFQSLNGVRRSFDYGDFALHVLVDAGLTCFCIASLEQNPTHLKKCFAFLDEMCSQFFQKYGKVDPGVERLAMNSKFSKKLKKRMRFYASDPAASRIAIVKDEFEQSKKIMIRNIEKSIANEINDEYASLVPPPRASSESVKYRKLQKKIRFSRFRRNLALIIVSAVICFVIIWLVISLVCGFQFDRCSHIQSPQTNGTQSNATTTNNTNTSIT